MLPAIILYEGIEDRRFLEKLIAARDIGLFAFHAKGGGYTLFGETLRGLKLEKGIEERKAIIIVADNDGNPSLSLTHIQNQITSGGWDAPEIPRQPKNQENLPPVYVLMIPWDDDEGCWKPFACGQQRDASPQN